jgi:hypothetical protein
MDLAIKQLSTLDAGKSTVELTTNANYVQLKKDKFSLVACVQLVQGPAKLIFDVCYTLDNVSGKLDTSRYLSRKLQQLLSQAYTLDYNSATQLTTILTQINKAIKFTIQVHGSVHQFNSFSYAFKVVNTCFDTAVVMWDGVTIPLNSYKNKANYSVYVIRDKKLVGNPTRLQAMGELPHITTMTVMGKKLVNITSLSGIDVTLFKQLGF